MHQEQKLPFFYTLPEIAAWVEGGKVMLPTVQRGFVWRPSQIENFWDSLLRGYPVGSFVLSPYKNGSFEMLDGQQRATAICLGYGRDTFRNSLNKFRVFIDLDKPGDGDNRKFYFRVITQAHPWGYGRTDNTKTLSSDEKRKAMDIYDREDYQDPDLDYFFPYDTAISIPFHLFLNAALKQKSSDELICDIYSWPLWKKVKDEWIIWRKENPNKFGFDENDELKTTHKIENRIREIFKDVKIMTDVHSGQKIPALYLDFERYKHQLNTTLNRNLVKVDKIYEQNGETSNNIDEIENLFIRLNSGGTPLRGEELNYSILKAHISPDLQKRIEDACEEFIQPSRFITIAYRLYQQKNKYGQVDGLNMRIKPKQFQRTISETKIKNPFHKFLSIILSERIYSGKSLLEYAREIIDYDEVKNPYGLPHLVTSRIGDSAPEVFFMLLYRLIVWKDRFELNSNIHRKAMGMITLFMWLGKGENQRDHSKLLINVWPCAITMNQNSFWSKSTVQRALLKNILVPFPYYNKRLDRKSLVKIKKYNPQVKTDVFGKYDKDTGFGLFINKMFMNRELILYSQRKFLAKMFKQKQYYQDDTNLPFDWDHISPSKFAFKTKRIPAIIKEWYGTIGNLRAWPYVLNRMDQDVVPSIKFNPLYTEANKNEEFNEIKDGKENWVRFINSNPNLIQSKEKLSESLLQWSVCADDPQWAECDIDDLKKNWRPVYELIRNRALIICKNWYEGLMIEELIPEKKHDMSVVFKSILHQRKWKINPWEDGDLKRDFKDSENHSWISKPVKINNAFLYLYVNFSKDMEEVLNVEAIAFGIYEKNGGKYLKSIKISEKDSEIYYYDRMNSIQGYFTLISHDQISYTRLFSNFNDWLKKFPNKEIKQLSTDFLNSINKRIKIGIEA